MYRVTGTLYVIREIGVKNEPRCNARERSAVMWKAVIDEILKKNSAMDRENERKDEEGDSLALLACRVFPKFQNFCMESNADHFPTYSNRRV